MALSHTSLSSLCFARNNTNFLSFHFFSLVSFRLSILLKRYKIAGADMCSISLLFTSMTNEIICAPAPRTHGIECQRQASEQQLLKFTYTLCRRSTTAFFSPQIFSVFVLCFSVLLDALFYFPFFLSFFSIPFRRHRQPQK